MKRNRTMLRSITFFSSFASSSISRSSASARAQGGTVKVRQGDGVAGLLAQPRQPHANPSPPAVTLRCQVSLSPQAALTCQQMAPGAHLLLLQLFFHDLHHILLGDMEHTQVAEPEGEEGLRWDYIWKCQGWEQPAWKAHGLLQLARS